MRRRDWAPTPRQVERMVAVRDRMLRERADRAAASIASGGSATAMCEAEEIGQMTALIGAALGRHGLRLTPAKLRKRIEFLDASDTLANDPPRPEPAWPEPVDDTWPAEMSAPWPELDRPTPDPWPHELDAPPARRATKRRCKLPAERTTDDADQ